MNDNTDETFVRTAPPLNRFTVKLGGPAPWEILTAADARDVADVLMAEEYTHTAARVLRYADAVDAMTPGYPERDMVTTDEELFF